MIDSSRVVAGTILRLRCSSCGAVFPHFAFSGEADSDTVGLCSASSCGVSEVVVAEANPEEWRDFDRIGASLIERRLEQQLSRNDLKVVRLLRVERAPNVAAGLSFSDFRKAYRPPALVYSCACCIGGESRVIEEVTLEGFQSSGGRVFLTGRLTF